MGGDNKNKPSSLAIHTGAQKTGSPQFLKKNGTGKLKKSQSQNTNSNQKIRKYSLHSEHHCHTSLYIAVRLFEQEF